MKNILLFLAAGLVLSAQAPKTRNETIVKTATGSYMTSCTGCVPSNTYYKTYDETGKLAVVVFVSGYDQSITLQDYTTNPMSPTEYDTLEHAKAAAKKIADRVVTPTTCFFPYVTNIPALAETK